MKKIQITFDQIIEEIKKIKFEDFDIVIGIARGGIVPASIISFMLKKELRLIWLNYRNKDNVQKYKAPRLEKEFHFNLKNKKILLVDDVSRTETTMETAKNMLKNNKINTFLINGEADYSLFQYKECIDFPWNKLK